MPIAVHAAAVPHICVPGMTDFGLTRELEAWERPKGVANQSAHMWSYKEGESGQDTDTPRYEGTSPRSEDSDMPAYVSQYLAGAQAGNGMQRCDDSEQCTPRYDSRPASNRQGCDDDTASYAPSAGTISTRASSSRPKIAFGRRVPEVSYSLPSVQGPV